MNGIEPRKLYHSEKYILFLFIGLFLLITNSIQAYMDYPYGVGFQLINLPLLPIDNENPGKGKVSGRISTRLINVWSIQRNRFIIDGEEGQIEPSIRYAITDNTQFGFSVPIISRGGGFLDQSIENFHRITGVSQGGRTHYSRNEFNTSYEPLAEYYPLFDKDLFESYFKRNYDFRKYPRNSSDPPIDIPTENNEARRVAINHYYPYLNEYKTEDSIGNYDSTARGNTKLYFQSTVFRGNFLFDKITAGGQVRVPTHSIELIGTPGTDFSVFAIYHKDWFDGKVNWKFGISYSQFEMQRYRNLDLRKNQWVFRPSIIYNINESWKAHFEYVYFASPILHWNRLSVPAHQVGLGISYRYNSYLYQIATFENIFTYSNTPDIGFLFSLEKLN
jgi:Protein of unknown function (DUF3187)